MEKDIDLGKDAPHTSGAPEAGGATSLGSIFGGRSLVARGWRMLARIARDLEATAYRRLRDLEARREHGAVHPGDAREPGAPRRVKEAARPHHRQPT